MRHETTGRECIHPVREGAIGFPVDSLYCIVAING